MGWQNDAFGLVIATVLTAALLLPLSMLLFNGTRTVAATERETVPEKDQSLLVSGVDEVKLDSVSKESRPTTSAPTAPLSMGIGQAPSLERKEPEPATTSVTDKSVKANTNNWRCACDGGFLPPGMFGNMEAVLKMGAGQCYHKQL